jgi:uncharacterized protein YegP (UPF0339 family)
MVGNRIVVFRTGVVRRGWAFRFVAANGEIVAQSETYSRKADAQAAALLVATGFVNAEIFDLD